MNETYKAATLMKFKGDLKVVEHKHRDLKDDEVLVKIMSTSILPADLALLEGLYGSKLPSLPAVFGMEGSGLIEKVGKNIDQSLIGKHCGAVSLSSKDDFHGNWSQYNYTTLEKLMIFDKPIDFDKIASCQGNPLTACGFIDTLIQSGKKSTVITGASSAFGRMFLKFCVQEGIDIVSVVRKQSSIEELTQMGGKYFVNTSEQGWEETLKKYCDELSISTVFDCAGGAITGKVFKAMNSNGVLYHFGNLELKRLSNIDPNDFIFGHKHIKGWWLVTWLAETSSEKLNYWKEKVKKDFEENDGKIFGTEFNSSFSLFDLEKAFEKYLTTSGKILLKPWE